MKKERMLTVQREQKVKNMLKSGGASEQNRGFNNLKIKSQKLTIELCVCWMQEAVLGHP
jgi:hypothetical protein